MGIFDSIKNTLSGVVGGTSSSGSVLGIDIGSSSIKVVQLKRSNGRAVLETYGSITLGPYHDMEAGRVVKLTPIKFPRH